MIRRARKVKDALLSSDVHERLKELIAEFNYLVEKGNFLFNDDTLVVEGVVFGPGEEKVIPHKLGKKPKHRIILNQEGNGVLSDIPSGWNQYQIKMKNNGAVSVTATIMIVRE